MGAHNRHVRLAWSLPRTFEDAEGLSSTLALTAARRAGRRASLSLRVWFREDTEQNFHPRDEKEVEVTGA